MSNPSPSLIEGETVGLSSTSPSTSSGGLQLASERATAVSPSTSSPSFPAKSTGWSHHESPVPSPLLPYIPLLPLPWLLPRTPADLDSGSRNNHYCEDNEMFNTCEEGGFLKEEGEGKGSEAGVAYQGSEGREHADAGEQIQTEAHGGGKFEKTAAQQQAEALGGRKPEQTTGEEHISDTPQQQAEAHGGLGYDKKAAGIEHEGGAEQQETEAHGRWGLQQTAGEGHERIDGEKQIEAHGGWGYEQTTGAEDGAGQQQPHGGWRVGIPRFVEVVIEVPKGSFIKRRGDGTVDYVGFLPCPFNYGSVPAFDALDGDPQDALVLGPSIPRGHSTSHRVEALLKFTDAGMVDHKLVCTPVSVSQSPLNTSLKSFSLDNGGRLGLFQGFLNFLNGLCGQKPECGVSLLVRKVAPPCPASCQGRIGTGIALPVARLRTTVRCAVCGGAMPFPAPMSSLATQNSLGSSPRQEVKADLSAVYLKRRSCDPWLKHGKGIGGIGAIGAIGGFGETSPRHDLVQVNLSLQQFIMLTGFFRFFATCKNVLNKVRGRDGTTTFDGWEVGHNHDACQKDRLTLTRL